MSALLLALFDAWVAITSSFGGEQEGPSAWLAVAAAALALLFGVSAARLFGKAGRRGLACVLPIYGDVVMLDAAGMSRWWAALLWVPLLYVLPIGLHDAGLLTAAPALALLPQLSWQLVATGGVVGAGCLVAQAIALAALTRRYGLGKLAAVGAVVAGVAVLPWLAFGPARYRAA